MLYTYRRLSLRASGVDIPWSYVVLKRQRGDGRKCRTAAFCDHPVKSSPLFNRRHALEDHRGDFVPDVFGIKSHDGGLNHVVLLTEPLDQTTRNGNLSYPRTLTI